MYLICDIMQMASQRPTGKEIHSPKIDLWDVVQENKDIDRICDLLKAMNTCNIADGLKEPETLLLASFEYKVYLIDERTNLWDIDKDGKLSCLSVGYFGEGVDGFVLDLAKKHWDDEKDWFSNFFTDKYFSELNEELTA